jgi:hypothetical protein
MATKKRKYFGGGGNIAEAAFAVTANTVAVFTYRERIILFVGSLLCAGILLWLPGLAGFPPAKDFNGSVLAANAPVLTMLMLVIAVVGCMIIGIAEASLIQDEASLFCCCVGLSALSIRAGAIRPVLQYSNGPAILIALAFETLLLSAIVLIGWIGLRIFLSRFHQKPVDDSSTLLPNEIAEPTFQDRLSIIAVQAIVMALLELLLVQSDSKAQAMAGVFIAAFLGSLAGYHFTQVPEAIWYLIGPPVVGIVGYLLAFFATTSLGTGEVHGWAAALARPVPLDYASLGIVGSLLGYWTSRRWAMPEPTDDDEAPAEPA